MSLGTGIFLAAVFIGVILLYLGTRDRWRWGRGLLRAFVALIALALIGGGALYAYFEWEKRPRKENSLYGVALGASEDDVIFLKGKPTHTNEGIWSYQVNTYSYKEAAWMNIGFKDRKVDYICGVGAPLDLPTVAGISGYSSFETLREKLGEPGHTAASEDKTKRIINYPKYQAAFMVEKNTIKQACVVTGQITFK